MFPARDGDGSAAGFFIRLGCGVPGPAHTAEGGWRTAGGRLPHDFWGDVCGVFFVSVRRWFPFFLGSACLPGAPGRRGGRTVSPREAWAPVLPVARCGIPCQGRRVCVADELSLAGTVQGVYRGAPRSQYAHESTRERARVTFSPRLSPRLGHDWETSRCHRGAPPSGSAHTRVRSAASAC